MNFNNKFYVSSACLPYKRISDSVTALAEAGIKNIELSGGTELYDGIKNELQELKNRYGISFLMHNYFPPPKEEFILNPATSDESEKSKMFTHIKKAMELARDLEISMFSIHSGFAIDILPLLKGLSLSIGKDNTPDKRSSIRTFYENIDHIIQNILNNSFRFAVENKETFINAEDCSLLSEPSEVFEFLYYYRKNPNIGFLLDLGHLNISSSMQTFDKFDFIEKLFCEYNDKIFELHLSDNDGVNDTHGVTDVNSWQITVLRKYRKFIRDIPIVLEWRDMPLEDIVRQYKMVVRNFA